MACSGSDRIVCRAFASVTMATLMGATPGAAEEGEERRFSWRPSLRVTGVYDDNVFFEDDGEEDDAGLWLKPRVELDYRAPAFELGADLSAELRRYASNSSLNDAYLRLKGFAEAGLLPGLTARLANAYVPHARQLGAPETDSNNLVQSNRTDAELRYWRELPRGREIEVGLRGTRFFSESYAADVPAGNGGTVVDRNFHANYWEGAGYAEVQSPLFRHVRTFLRAQLRQRVFDDTGRTDFRDASLLAGIRKEWVRDLSLDVAGGYGLVDRDEGDNESRFLGRAALEYRTDSGWRFDLSLRNQFSADLAGNDFVDTTGRLEVEKHFGTRTAALASFFVTRLENDSWDADQNLYGGAEIELRRKLSRSTQLSLSYRYWQNGGDYELDDFQQNRVALEFTYRR